MSQELIRYAWIDTDQTTQITVIEDYSDDFHPESDDVSAYQFTYAVVPVDDENQTIDDFIVNGGSEDRSFNDQASIDARLNTVLTDHKNHSVMIVEDDDLTTPLAEFIAQLTQHLTKGDY